VFTILQSSANIITGAGYTGPLNVMNFPNPFNLKLKTVTLQDPGSASASQTTEGTMIKISAPANIGGALKIEIYSVTGELVREISGTITAGTHTYVEWDGKNDGGKKVASGAYVARVTIGGDNNQKFIKMAVIK
jgi:flagellar hook assembly protein FlgD